MNPTGGGMELMTMAFHCTGPFIISLLASPYDLDNVERDVNHQLIIVI